MSCCLLLLQASFPISHVKADNTNDEYAVPQKVHEVSTTESTRN